VIEKYLSKIHYALNDEWQRQHEKST